MALYIRFYTVDIQYVAFRPYEIVTILSLKKAVYRIFIFGLAECRATWIFVHRLGAKPVRFYTPNNFNALCQAKNKNPIYRVFGFPTLRISPQRMLGCVEYQRMTVALSNFQFSIFNSLAKGGWQNSMDSTKHYFARTKYKIFFT